MDIVEKGTKVRAAKTSGICRKAIADASHLLGVAANIRATFNTAKETLESNPDLSPEAVNDLLGSISSRIVSVEAEANRNLDSVLNAILKAFDGVKDVKDKSEKLEMTRGVFELVENIIPQQVS